MEKERRDKEAALQKRIDDENEAKATAVAKICGALHDSSVAGAEDMFKTLLGDNNTTISRLRIENKQLREKLFDCERINVELAAENATLVKALANAEESKEAAILDAGGISSYTLTSEKFHERFKLACKVIFGFKTYSDMKCRLRCFFRMTSSILRLTECRIKLLTQIGAVLSILQTTKIV